MASQRLSAKKEAMVARALGVPVGAVANRGNQPGWQVYDPAGQFLGYFSWRMQTWVSDPPRIRTLADMYRANGLEPPPDA